MHEPAAPTDDVRSPTRADLIRAEQRAHEAEMFAADAAGRALDAERAAVNPARWSTACAASWTRSSPSGRREIEELTGRMQRAESECAWRRCPSARRRGPSATTRWRASRISRRSHVACTLGELACDATSAQREGRSPRTGLTMTELQFVLAPGGNAYVRELLELLCGEIT